MIDLLEVLVAFFIGAAGLLSVPSVFITFIFNRGILARRFKLLDSTKLVLSLNSFCGLDFCLVGESSRPSFVSAKPFLKFVLI